MNGAKFGRRNTYVVAAAAFLLTIAFILYPEDAFHSSVGGLRLWFDVALPALLPFFVMAEILMGLGVIHFIGVLLEPLMRPLFRIPGAGAFAAALGLAAGYPLGAKLAGNLARTRLCTGVEGERLVSLANTADPLFMVGAVAVGMFHIPGVGGVLAVSHYAAILTVGLFMRFHGRGAPETPETPSSEPTLRRAARALVDARNKDGRPLGTLFGDAVRESFGALLFIGGTIIMFSVFIRLFATVGAMDLLTGALAKPLSVFGVDPTLIHASIVGAFEITNGAKIASGANASLAARVAVASGVIAWSGLSVHAQVAAMLHGTDIRIGPYIAARIAHAGLAGVIAWLLLGPASGFVNVDALPVITPAWAVEAVGFSARLFHATASATQIGLAAGGMVLLALGWNRLGVFWTGRRA